MPRKFEMPYSKREVDILAIIVNAVLTHEGTGTFKGEEGTDPYVGQPGKRHEEKEIKIEVIFHSWLEQEIVACPNEMHILMKK